MEDESKINWKKLYFELLKRVAVLEAEIKELREKLNPNSNNSSKPPSQDPFRKSRTSQPSGKKTGVQPGHPGHVRKMYPQERVTKTLTKMARLGNQSGEAPAAPDGHGHARGHVHELSTP